MASPLQSVALADGCLALGSQVNLLACLPAHVPGILLAFAKKFTTVFATLCLTVEGVLAKHMKQSPLPALPEKLTYHLLSLYNSSCLLA